DEPLRAPLRLARSLAVFRWFRGRRGIVLGRSSFLLAQRNRALDGVRHLRRERLYLRDDGLCRLGNLFLDRLDDAFVTHRIPPFVRATAAVKIRFQLGFGDDISTQRYGFSWSRTPCMRNCRGVPRITGRAAPQRSNPF